MEACAIKGPIEEKCQPQCTGKFAAYEACTKRIVGDTTGKANCEGQFMEYIQCLDKCIVPKLWPKLK
eukprot:TRINITY_DN35246_c0_g1_i1.p1 TRINITY_DN35246_c0_g1~~TRINITY_DN35246_c0_g1_i1.p1  ORF type:complete len:67 (+),score=19.39 TRINITY_DN35246_c0_g1_i1:37-237(+)